MCIINLCLTSSGFNSYEDDDDDDEDDEDDDGAPSPEALAYAERRCVEQCSQRGGRPPRWVSGRGKGKGPMVAPTYLDTTDDEQSYGENDDVGYDSTTTIVDDGIPKLNELITSFENHIAYHIWNGNDVSWCNFVFISFLRDQI